MMKKEMRKLRESFRNALRGLALCVRGERNLRIHIVSAFYVLVFAFMGRASTAELVMFSLCFSLMFCAELLNTAIEWLCDKMSTGYDSIVRNAKDTAAAAVFVCAAFCVIVGLLLFLREGILFRALAFLQVHPVVFTATVCSIPLALIFIFQYNRRKK